MEHLSWSFDEGKTQYRLWSGESSQSLTRYFPLVKNSERFTLGKEDKNFPLLKNRGFPWSKTL
jgi:hypothetical protein